MTLFFKFYVVIRFCFNKFLLIVWVIIILICQRVGAGYKDNQDDQEGEKIKKETKVKKDTKIIETKSRMR